MSKVAVVFSHGHPDYAYEVGKRVELEVDAAARFVEAGYAKVARKADAAKVEDAPRNDPPAAKPVK